MFDNRNIAFFSKEGIELFQKCALNPKVFKYINAFEPQQHPTFCGLAIISILKKYRSLETLNTQLTIQDEVIRSEIKSKSEITGTQSPGLENQLSALLNIHCFECELYKVEALNEPISTDILQKLAFATQSESECIIVNYDRKH